MLQLNVCSPCADLPSPLPQFWRNLFSIETAFTLGVTMGRYARSSELCCSISKLLLRPGPEQPNIFQTWKYVHFLNALHIYKRYQLDCVEIITKKHKRTIKNFKQYFWAFFLFKKVDKSRHFWKIKTFQKLRVEKLCINSVRKKIADNRLKQFTVRYNRRSSRRAVVSSMSAYQSQKPGFVLQVSDQQMKLKNISSAITSPSISGKNSKSR